MPEFDRVNRDTNDYYTQIDKDEKLMADNEEAERERVNSRVDEIMGGDDSDLLAEVLNETPWCVNLLSLLCECETDKDIADMTERELIILALAAKRLVDSIQYEVKKGVEAGNYP